MFSCCCLEGGRGVRGVVGGYISLFPVLNTITRTHMESFFVEFNGLTPAHVLCT